MRFCGCGRFVFAVLIPFVLNNNYLFHVDGL